MSYSVCLNCKQMVSRFEKYCDECAQVYPQDMSFWENHTYEYLTEPIRTNELLKDNPDVDPKDLEAGDE